MPLAIGENFAGYIILRVLGAGAMGTVYLVQHPRLPRQDALKVLSADLSTDPQFRARFLREADVAAGLSHPNIVGVHDRGECRGQFWISIDFVRGTDAAKLLRDRYRTGMPVGLAMQIITAVASALDYAHQRGLLHRDVKPANILIADPGTESQRVFLADFGIARRVDDTGLTATNMAVGTVAYAAPEQLMGDLIDGRADQYALACTAFHLLTGTQPYECATSAAVIAKHVMEAPPPIGGRRSELASLDPVFARAMAKKPAERFSRCQDFTRALQDALDAGVTRRTPGHAGADDTMLAPDIVYGPSSPYPATQAAPGPRTPDSTPVAEGDKEIPATGRQGRQPRRRRRGIVLAGIAVVVAVVAAVAILVTQTGGSANSPAGRANSALPNTGPFTGTYTADFGPLVSLTGNEIQGTPPSKETWKLRSGCVENACSANASRAKGTIAHPTNLVFDDVGGRWLAVALGKVKCQNRDTEEWNYVWLRPGPDGTMAGEWISDAFACYSKRNVTFTRTGDTDVASMPDPAGLPARVVSPAQGLRGVYHSVTTYTGGAQYAPQESDYRVDTICLRAGDRCLSRFLMTDGSGHFEMLVFANGSWSRDEEFDSPCSAGGTSHVKINGGFPLPNPPQDPISQLVGHGYKDNSANTQCKSSNYDQTFNRTGD